MSMWNPWRGCVRFSEGCLHCYIHKGDIKRGIDTGSITRTDDFDKPVRQKKNGDWAMKSGLCTLCFFTDFLIAEADDWRPACWDMIRRRPDVTFLFLTKRIERFAACVPEDWGDGWDNVVVGCTVENQQRADERLSVFRDLPIRHKCITAQPLLEEIHIEPYLHGMESVLVGGESDKEARPFDFGWALSLREQCVQADVPFTFRQCGTHFVKDGRLYTLQVRDLGKQARAAGIDFTP